jgi:hypothetical protein
MTDVRSRNGFPIPEDFRSGAGTPLVVDRETTASYVLRSPDDEIIEVGQRAGWNDYLAPISLGKIAGANQPNWDPVVGGVSAYSFSATIMNEIWLFIHCLHDYAPETMIYPHIHWASAGANTGVCRWGVEWTYARGYGVEAFPATQTFYLQQAALGGRQMQIVEAPEGAGLIIPNFEPDGLLLIRVFRDAANVNDTLTDRAFGFYCDIHFQTDGMLTEERNRPFTKKRGQL